MLQKEDTQTSVIDQVQLTTVSVPEEICTDYMSLPKPKADPYPNKTPSSIVGREFLILNKKMAVDHLEIIHPFEELLKDKTVSEYLKLFKFFRSDVDVTINCTTTQSQFGAYLVSTLPYTGSTTQWTTNQQLFQADGHLLDITSEEGIKMTLPYVNPDLYFDLEQTRQENPTYLPAQWRIAIKPIYIGTVTNDAPTDIQVRVLASFSNPEAAGYLPNVAKFQSGMNAPVLPTNEQSLRRMQQSPNGFVRAAGYGMTAAKAGIPSAVGYGLWNWFSGKAEETAAAYNITGVSDAQPSPPSDFCKLQVVSDLTSQNTEHLNFSVLGDNISKKYEFMPTLKDIIDIPSLCSVPTWIATKSLTTTADVLDIDCSPFIPGSHCQYLARCFKYAKANTRIALRFCGSPYTAGTVRVTLFPVSTPPAATETPSTFGDLPTWLLTVKGPETFVLEIPYLQMTPVIEIGAPAVTFSHLRVQLVDSLSQPFDKATSLGVIAYGSATNVSFSGLQSCVPARLPAPPEPAIFQSCHQVLSSAITLGSTHTFSYQGGTQNVYQMMNRFSNRDPDPEKLYPFPVRINSADDLAAYDNFDYLANLYKFYAGDTNIKLVFSKAPASGVLQVAIQNSRITATGRDFKAGNSTLVSHQAVWPVLEYRYPYQNEVEFDSIWEPRAMFAQKVSEGATISEMFISRSDNFRLHYLLPVPDFAQPAVFQSINRGLALNSDCRSILLTAGATGVTYQIATTLTPNAWSEYEIKAAVTRTAGTTDGNFVVQISSAASTAAVNPGYSSTAVAAHFPLMWVDVSNSGKATYTGSDRSLWFGSTNAPTHVNIRRVGTSTDSEFNFTVCTDVRPITQLAAVTTSALAPCLVDTVITSSTLTMDVEVVNQPSVKIFDVEPGIANALPIEGPVQATIVNTPLPVSGTVDAIITNEVDVLVINTDPISVSAHVTNTDPILVSAEVINTTPISVAIDGTIQVAGRVQGVVDPDTPVYITAYN